jgi:hypothetical protein
MQDSVMIFGYRLGFWGVRNPMEILARPSDKQKNKMAANVAAYAVVNMAAWTFKWS